MEQVDEAVSYSESLAGSHGRVEDAYAPGADSNYGATSPVRSRPDDAAPGQSAPCDRDLPALGPSTLGTASPCPPPPPSSATDPTAASINPAPPRPHAQRLAASMISRAAPKTSLGEGASILQPEHSAGEQNATSAAPLGDGDEGTSRAGPASPSQIRTSSFISRSAPPGGHPAPSRSLVASPTVSRAPQHAIPAMSASAVGAAPRRQRSVNPPPREVPSTLGQALGPSGWPPEGPAEVTRANSTLSVGPPPPRTGRGSAPKAPALEGGGSFPPLDAGGASPRGSSAPAPAPTPRAQAVAPSPLRTGLAGALGVTPPPPPAGEASSTFGPSRRRAGPPSLPRPAFSEAAAAPALPPRGSVVIAGLGVGDAGEDVISPDKGTSRAPRSGAWRTPAEVIATSRAVPGDEPLLPATEASADSEESEGQGDPPGSAGRAMATIRVGRALSVQTTAADECHGAPRGGNEAASFVLEPAPARVDAGVPSTVGQDTDQDAGASALLSGQPSVDGGGRLGAARASRAVPGPGPEPLDAEPPAGGAGAQPASPSQVSRGSVYFVSATRARKRGAAAPAAPSPPGPPTTRAALARHGAA